MVSSSIFTVLWCTDYNAHLQILTQPTNSLKLFLVWGSLESVMSMPVLEDLTLTVFLLLLRGSVYLGDFNARHPAIGDHSRLNRNGGCLMSYIRNHNLTRWGTGGATHSRGGTLDHILTVGLVTSCINFCSVPELFSDHIALKFSYSLPTVNATSVFRLRILFLPSTVQHIFHI